MNDAPRKAASEPVADVTKTMKQTSKTEAERREDDNAPNGPNDGPELSLDTQPPPSTAPADPEVAKRGA